MSSRTVIAAVMVEVAKDIAGVTYGVGHRELAEANDHPRVDWVPVQGVFRGPQMSGHNPRPLQNRWTRWDVRCWGADLDATELILAAVVRGCHLALGKGGYEVEGETWAEVGVVSDGEQVTVGVYLGIPVCDRPQPTLNANTGTANVTGTVRPP